MKATKLSLYLFALLSCSLITIWTGCSGNTGSDDGEAGEIVYRLSWSSTPAMATHRSRALSVTGNVCEDYHIEWIQAEAVDQDGTPRASGKWPCIQRKGELTGIPAGTYNIRIEGEVAGAINWRGEVADAQVSKNERTDVGLITMHHLKDPDPPFVFRTVPAHEAQNVPIDTAVTATFDEAVVAQSIGAENFILTYTDPSGAIQQVTGKIHYDKENHNAVMIPAAALLNGTSYNAAITVDGTKVVQDVAGNPMQETFQWSFTTSNTDTEGPLIVSRSPNKNTMDVATTAIVQIQFSEPVNPQTITTDSVRLEDHGAAIQCNVQYDDQLSMVTLTPINGLPVGTTLTVVATTDIVDTGGHPMAAADSWSFVTQFPPWHTELLQVDHHSDLTTRIALETNDTVHIKTRSETNSQAVNSKRISENNWDNMYSTLPGGIGEHFDLAYSKKDTRYSVDVEKDDNKFEIYIALTNGGGLARSPIDLDDPMTNLKGVSMATHYKTDAVSICYYDASDAQLKYFGVHTKSKGASETVDTASSEHCDIAVSPEDVLHLSYQDPAKGHLRYATRTPEDTWSKETLDDGTAIGSHTAIAVDRAGNPHICFRDESNASLKYAYRQPTGDWLIETVDDSVAIDVDPSIAVDSLGQAHISYRDSVNQALKYAVKTGTGLWYTQLVDTENSNGFGSSIAVDSKDYVHISYCHNIPVHFGNNVRYATTRPQN